MSAAAAPAGAGGRTAASAARSVRHGRDRFQVKPSHADLVDAVFVVVLCGLGILGFRTTYGGTDYLMVGAVAATFGVALAYVANRLEQPVFALAAVTVVVFFLLGGVVALRTTAVAGVFPTFTTFQTLSNTSVSGWKDLLTTLPPVGSSHHLLALPYVIGLLGGVTAMCLAARARRAALPLLPLAVVLAVGILFGTSQPAALFLQGSVFATLALAWLVMRRQRLRPSLAGRGRVNRLVGGVALLACACAGAQTVASYLPFTGTHHRVVLRTYTHPPFDPGAYPSPLAGFRQYVGPKSKLNDTTLFTVSGLPAGSRIRIATTDAYSGLVWAFDTDVSPSASDSFQRVGSSIPPIVRGTVAGAKITIGAYNDVWLPDAGYVTGLTFNGHDAAALENSFRYNVSTGTAVVPSGLRSGDTYRFATVLPPTPDAANLEGASPASVPVPITGVPPQVATDAKQWTSKATGAYSKLQALATYLKANGEYSDGETAGGDSPPVLPGHGTKRIADFLNGQHLVGDGEQYAATMALMSNELGFPARVVFGAIPEADGTVKGKDIAAWMEADFVGIGWVAFDATPSASHKPQPAPPQLQQASTNSQVVPPPPVAAPPPADNPNQTSSTDKQTAHKSPQAGRGFEIPGWMITGGMYAGPPLALLVAFLVLVFGLKWRRRRRRRSRGPATSRLAGGWYEVVDVARDIGITVPAGRTRREQARSIGDTDLQDLARGADAAIFGPGTPTSSDVETYWAHVDVSINRLKKASSRWRRLRGAISLRSFHQAATIRPAPRDLPAIPRQASRADRESEMAGQR